MKQPGSVLLTIYDYLLLYLGLALLGVLCLSWTCIAIFLHVLLPQQIGTRIGRYVIMAGFRIYLGCLQLSRRCYFDLTALDQLRGQGPLIIAPNHPGLLDAVMVISRLPKIACIMKSQLMNNVFLGAGARLARYIRNESIRQMVLQASDDLAGGSHLLLFPEGTRTGQYPINPLKGSIALIAARAQVPVQTVLIEANSRFLGKGWPLQRKPAMPLHYRIRLGRRFAPPTDTHAFMLELEQYFKQALGQSEALPEKLPQSMVSQLVSPELDRQLP